MSLRTHAPRRSVAALLGLLTILALSPTAALADDGLAIGSVGVTSGDALRVAPAYEAEATTQVAPGTDVIIADGPMTAADGSLWYQVAVWGQYGYMPTYAVDAGGATSEPVVDPMVEAVEEVAPVEAATVVEEVAPVEAAPVEDATMMKEVAAAPVEMAEPVATGGGGQAIADFAMGFVGYPYVYAGAGPGGFDCSGFTMYVIGQTLGIDITHDMFVQASMGTPVDQGSLQPGDLVFFQNTFQPGLSHAGVYVGGGQFVHAENESTGVKISDLGSDYYSSRWYGAVRLG